MLPRAPFALAALVVFPHLARADEGVNAIIAGNVSATDNANQDASGTKHPDGFVQIRPGLLFGYETPRGTYTAATDVEATEYLQHPADFAVTVHGRATAAWVVTPLTSANVALAASTGKTNILAGRQSPDQNVVTGLLPGGAGDVYQVGGGQGASHILTKTLSLSESLAADFVQTNGDAAAVTRSMQGSLALQIRRTLEENSIGLEVGATVVRLVQFIPGDAAAGVMDTGRLDKQFIPRAAVFWRHDISRRWSSNLAGGLGAIVPFGDDPYNPMTVRNRRIYTPIGGGSLNYTDVWGYAALAVAHAVAPNLLIAQNTISDTATLSAAVPIAWIERHGRTPRYTLAASAGIFRSKIVDDTNADANATYSGEHLDIGVAYLPGPSQTFSLRYTLAHQTASTGAGAIVAVPALTTNTISLVFTLRYPERVRVVEPKHTSVRADETDMLNGHVDDTGEHADPNAGDGKDVGGNAHPQSSGTP